MPVFVLSAHAFSNHKHTVCTSKVEKHLHKKNIDCKLNIHRINHVLLVVNDFNIHSKTNISTDISSN